MQIGLSLILARWMVLLVSISLLVAGKPSWLIQKLDKPHKAFRIEHTPPFLESTAIRADSHQSVTAPSILEKRFHGMRIAKVANLRNIIPIDIAARSMIFFYEALALKSSTTWRTLPPHETLQVRAGNVYISFVSMEPISWDFVTDFANAMIRATQSGYTFTYDLIWHKPATSSAIHVALRVIENHVRFETRSGYHIGLGGTSGERGKPNAKTSETIESLKERQQLGQQPPNLGSLANTFAQLSTPSKMKLNTRTLPLSNPAKGWEMMKFTSTTMILPVQVAQLYLQDFYDIIALKIETGFYDNIAPLHNLVLTRFGYQLSFFCYAAPVPWDFVQDVAIEMGQWAEKGFTTQFKSTYRALDPLGQEMFISVALELIKETAKDALAAILPT